MGSPPPNGCEIVPTRSAMPRAAAPPCEPRQPFDQAGAETRKSRPLSSFFAIDSCFFSTSDAENSMVELHRWLSHQHLGVRNLYRPWAKDERACARCNTSCGQQAVGVDHRSVDLNPSTKKPPPARRTLERLRDIMGEDDDAISLASERQIDTLNKLAGPEERV